MKVLRKVILLLVLSLGILGAGFAYITTTPLWPLHKIHQAIQQKDTEHFKHYCELDSLSESILEGLWNFRKDFFPPPFSQTLEHMVSSESMAFMFRQLLLKQIQNELIRGIRENAFQYETVEDYRVLMNFAMAGQVGRIRVELKTKSQKFPIVLLFKKIEGKWKLAGMEQVENFLSYLYERKANG